ncbi:hypothetical protein Syun_001472 [Stephania yunnanensis]|uniref:Uncharacterized protein n=1 Tax=Stephania yunnanensis TaxID=152371 RepID=A0AAP0LDS5_9MAGN
MMIGEESETKEFIRGQAQLWKHMQGYLETHLLRLAVELGIPDLIHDHGNPITLTELATKLPIPTLNLDKFKQTMKFMVHMNLFAADETDGETKYSLTPASKLLLLKPNNNNKSLAKFVLMNTDPMELSWPSLGHAEWNAMLVEGLDCGTSIMVDALVEGLRREKVIDEGVATTMVDVGGNTGTVSKAIANAFPQLKCYVLDIAPVVERVTESHPQLEFVVGDMFVLVPNADLVLLKSVLHDFQDDVCIKILKNCKEAINPKNGKLIVVDILIDDQMPEFGHARLGMAMAMTIAGVEHVGGDMFVSIPKGDAIFMKCYEALPDEGKVIVVETIVPAVPNPNNATRLSYTYGLLMMALSSKVKERTKEEFEALAKKSGFAGIRLACDACSLWVIEFLKMI